eukprot:CAMPEP_0172550756 /NCGR_PEP_ID=MMETSP1067-20121228/32901_1 /TAXON_ID=265564 ORGANISM="Thalassiosira punctigera, Strain Tpunct2005C2" /NCGR_SAMPLE_ID=MMETSP1067 /ASSEMBLY_ACC=CAM_ASM_000444 /LENGTH=86 /DNA_ID=CAMNT_0013338417 /DNA_START=66 /DNA_END=326 /DNA_ORIENTATION=-
MAAILLGTRCVPADGHEKQVTEGVTGAAAGVDSTSVKGGGSGSDDDSSWPNHHSFNHRKKFAAEKERPNSHESLERLEVPSHMPPG